MSLIKILDWDSNIFGVSMAAINTPKLTLDMIPSIKNDVAKQQIHFLQYLVDCEDLCSIHQAEAHGFHFIDVRLTFQKTLFSADRLPEKKDGIDFGLATPSHLPALMAMSTDLYQDFRYYADTHFPREKVDTFYQTWLNNAVYGKYDHLCYCLFIKDVPIGYCTIRYHDQHIASIGLFGIAKEYQRKSLGHYLLQLVCTDLSSKGYTEIYVVTQGKNIGAQRTYQGNGFKTLKTEMWYHQWF